MSLKVTHIACVGMLYFAATAILLLSLCLPALADLATGQQAMRNGDFDTAVKELLPLANQGNPVAKYNLGLLYHEGRGVAKDYGEAVRWFRSAAEQGDRVGQFLFGWCYQLGDGVAKDYEEAARWFRLAADQGEPTAQLSLGLAYFNGQGVKQDYLEAIRWFQKSADQKNARAQFSLGVMHAVAKDFIGAGQLYRLAADQGEPDAQYNLGLVYEAGQGVPQDYVQAHMWLNLAGARGNANGTSKRNSLAAKMTPDQIAEAQRLARVWKPTPVFSTTVANATPSLNSPAGGVATDAKCDEYQQRARERALQEQKVRTLALELQNLQMRYQSAVTKAMLSQQQTSTAPVTAGKGTLAGLEALVSAIGSTAATFQAQQDRAEAQTLQAQLNFKQSEFTAAQTSASSFSVAGPPSGCASK